jgi:hypothetical protein
MIPPPLVDSLLSLIVNARHLLPDDLYSYPMTTVPNMQHLFTRKIAKKYSNFLTQAAA